MGNTGTCAGVARRQLIGVLVLAVGAVMVTAGLMGEPADAAVRTETTAQPVSCEDLATPEVAEPATEFSTTLLPIDGDLFLPTPERETFLARGGQYCAWLAAGSPLHVAYSPITPSDALAEQAALESAGLTRTADGDTVTYELLDVPAFTVPEVFGRHLFADGYEYVVKFTTTGSGGTSVLNVEPAMITSVREVVLRELGTAAVVAEDPPATAEDAESADLLAPAPSRFSATTPSVLSELRTAATTFADPLGVAAAVALGLVLTALVAVPTALLNHAITEGYDRLRRRVAGWRDALRPRRNSGTPRAGRPRRDMVAVAIGIPLAALITVFIDPRAGLNPGTARLFASNLVGLAIESLAVLAFIAWMLRRRGASAYVQLRLGSLVILVLAVIATRLTGFEPGFVFGVVVAVALVGAPSDDDEQFATRWELRLLSTVVAVAWLLYSALSAVSSGDNTMIVFLSETLASLTLGGITALFVLALPVGSTPGALLFRANRLRWTAVFAGIVAAFCVIIVPLPESWQAVSAPFTLWVGLFAGYSALAVAAWILVTKHPVAAASSTPVDSHPHPIEHDR